MNILNLILIIFSSVIGKDEEQSESGCWHMRFMQGLLLGFVFNVTLEATDISDSEINYEISERMSSLQHAIGCIFPMCENDF